MNFGFAFRKDFPYLTIFGLIVSLVLIFYTQGIISKELQDNEDNFSITDPSPCVAGEPCKIIFEFSDLAIWILISLLYAIFLIIFFILPLSLYFRGMTQWEWDPTNVIFWLLVTRGFSVFGVYGNGTVLQATKAGKHWSIEVDFEEGKRRILGTSLTLLILFQLICSLDKQLLPPVICTLTGETRMHHLIPIFIFNLDKYGGFGLGGS